MIDKIKTSPYAYPVFLAATICLGLFLASLYARPLFPVDETRYLTVAWEMHQSGNWILPTLNHEAYHHKPPILFWLINLLWGIFGVSQGTAMAVPYLAAFAFLLLTARLSTRLFPDRPQAPLMSTAILAGSLPFVIYSNLIMFDLLLGVFALLGLTAIWDYATTKKPAHLLLLALAIGLGVLTKGPVILLHVGTTLLLIKFWLNSSQSSLKKTILPFIGAIFCGALIALSWAIPAAIEGGKEFADKIFWGQTAGRMVKSFDHQRPVYWYLIFIPLFLLPWLTSPNMWAGLKTLMRSTSSSDKTMLKFLLSWGGPVFIAFCLISGKQVHYLIPLLPCLALFFTAAFLNSTNHLRKRDIWPILITIIVLTLIPVLLHIFASEIGKIAKETAHIEETFTNMTILPALVISGLIAGIGLLSLRSKITALITTSLSMTLMMISFQIAAKPGFFTNYDLTPMAEQVQQYPDNRPLAFVRNYHGEYGFLARLNRPVKQIMPGQIPQWFKDNPDGLVFYRTKRPLEFARYHVLFTMPYKMGDTYALIEAPK